MISIEGTTLAEGEGFQDMLDGINMDAVIGNCHFEQPFPTVHHALCVKLSILMGLVEAAGIDDVQTTSDGESGSGIFWGLGWIGILIAAICAIAVISLIGYFVKREYFLRRSPRRRNAAANRENRQSPVDELDTDDAKEEMKEVQIPMPPLVVS